MKTNDEILKEPGLKISMVKTIRKKQLQFLGQYKQTQRAKESSPNQKKMRVNVYNGDEKNVNS